jgi:hypothetical protein
VLSQTQEFEEEFLSAMKANHKDIMASIAKGNIGDAEIAAITKTANDLMVRYKN